VAKTRVSSLAKELNVGWKEIVDACQKLGYITVIYHANVLEDEQVARITEILGGPKPQAPAEEQPQPAQPPAEPPQAAPPISQPAPIAPPHPAPPRSKPPAPRTYSPEMAAYMGAAAAGFRMGPGGMPMPAPPKQKPAPPKPAPETPPEEKPAQAPVMAEAVAETAAVAVTEAPPQPVAEAPAVPEPPPPEALETPPPEVADPEVVEVKPADEEKAKPEKKPAKPKPVVITPRDATPTITGPRIVRKGTKKEVADTPAAPRRRFDMGKPRVTVAPGRPAPEMPEPLKESTKRGEKGKKPKEKEADRREDLVVVEKAGAKKRRPRPFEPEQTVTHVAGHTVTISDQRKEKFTSSAGKAKPARRTIIIRRADRVQPKRERDAKVEITPPITLKSLSEKSGIRAPELIRDLMFKHGVQATLNYVIDEEVAVLLGMEHGLEIVVKKAQTVEEKLKAATDQDDKPEDLRPRPPVVTMLGHVDHGKTSLLDRIRSSDVAKHEAGGITQHFGAYQVETSRGPITFLDTPGHEAFTAMRARGANLTDIAILVVAADDGVMPQTEEAISHAKAAEVPIIVAMNKMDKPQADPQKVMQQLAGKGLIPEEWGGQTGVCPVSAITGEGIDQLLERISLEAEVLEMKANPSRPAMGRVLEAKLQAERGPTVTVLVQNGTLKVGDIIVCGASQGRARALFNYTGDPIETAGPSVAAQIIGLDDVPEPGDEFRVVETLDTARKVADDRVVKKREAALGARKHISLENLFADMAAKQTRNLNIVLKVDVFGSLEPLTGAFGKLGTKEVDIQVLHSGVGGVTEADVLLADASDAVVIGFNVVADERARAAAEARGIEIRTYKIIYELVDELKAALEGMLEPEQREIAHGRAEVRQIFRISRVGNIAGCYCREGRMVRSGRLRLLRDNVIIYEGAVESLRRGKDDVREVASGMECGIRIAGFNDVKEGDIIECFGVEKIHRTLDSARRAEKAAKGE